MKKDVKKYSEFIKEATTDTNIQAMQNTTATYNKYKSRVTSMFNGAKSEDIDKISKNFEDFVNGLSDEEKGASDMLRTLFSSEKMKLAIKSLEEQKKLIDDEINQRLKDLKQISDNLP